MHTQTLPPSPSPLDAAPAISATPDYIEVDRHLFWRAHEQRATLWTAPVGGGPVRMVNRAIESLTGFTPDEVRTADTNIWIEGAHADDRERIAGACGAALSSGETIDLEYRWQRKDGTWIWLRSRTAVRFTLQGPVVDGAMTNVTERRRLEDELRQLQQREVEALAVDAAPAKPEPAPARRETIMVVEDDPGVLDLVSRMLHNFGYTVLRAEGGEEAMAHLVRHDGTIDLVLSDVVIPGANGPIVVREIARLAPKARVLFMSGHSDRTLAAKGLLTGVNHFIKKPFTLDALRAKVREVLDA